MKKKYNKLKINIKIRQNKYKFKITNLKINKVNYNNKFSKKSNKLINNQKIKIHNCLNKLNNNHK